MRLEFRIILHSPAVAPLYTVQIPWRIWSPIVDCRPFHGMCAMCERLLLLQHRSTKFKGRIRVISMMVYGAIYGGIWNNVRNLYLFELVFEWTLACSKCKHHRMIPIKWVICSTSIKTMKIRQNKCCSDCGLTKLITSCSMVIITSPFSNRAEEFDFGNWIHPASKSNKNSGKYYSKTSN